MGKREKRFKIHMNTFFYTEGKHTATDIKR